MGVACRGIVENFDESPTACAKAGDDFRSAVAIDVPYGREDGPIRRVVARPVDLEPLEPPVPVGSIIENGNPALTSGAESHDHFIETVTVEIACGGMELPVAGVIGVPANPAP